MMWVQAQTEPSTEMATSVTFTNCVVHKSHILQEDPDLMPGCYCASVSC